MANYNSSREPSALAATAFEARYRVWILAALYLLALACFRFDRRDIAFTVARRFALVSAGFMPEVTTARLVYLFGALLIAIAAYLRTRISAWSTAPRVHHPFYLDTILLFIGFGFLLNRMGFLLLISGNYIVDKIADSDYD